MNAYKLMSENTVNQALRIMGYDTKTTVCGHRFKSSLVESRDMVEYQMGHQKRNDVRASYIDKAQHIGERTKIVQ